MAIVFFFVLFGMTFLNFFSDGYEWDYQSFGLAASGTLVIIVNLQVGKREGWSVILTSSILVLPLSFPCSLPPPPFPVSSLTPKSTLIPSLPPSLPPSLKIALDTYHWNPIQHVAVWGSIATWFVIIPITSSPAFYSPFFVYNGVAYEVMGSAAFWFYWPLATIISLMPTICFRLIQLDLHPRFIDDVRLKEKKEGKKLFKRRTIRRKSVRRERSGSVKRSGYAFSHQEGFAQLIMSGLGFGLKQDRVEKERQERLTTLINSAPNSLAGSPMATRRQKLGPGIETPDSEAERFVTEESRQVTVDVHASPSRVPIEPSASALPGAIQSPSPEPPAEGVSMEERSEDLGQGIASDL